MRGPGLCRQRPGELDKRRKSLSLRWPRPEPVCVFREAHRKCADSPPSLTHCTLCLWIHPASAHNDTLYLSTMWRERGVPASPPPSTRPGVYCLRCSGWRQALKKQELKNTLFWWGGCSCGFVIAITIRGPDRLTELEAEGVVEEEEGGRKRYVIPHATQREGTERERKRKRDVGAWQCVCLPLFFPYLLTNLSLPPIPPHPPPASRLSWVRQPLFEAGSCLGSDSNTLKNNKKNGALMSSGSMNCVK